MWHWCLDVLCSLNTIAEYKCLVNKFNKKKMKTLRFFLHISIIYSLLYNVPSGCCSLFNRIESFKVNNQYYDNTKIYSEKTVINFYRLALVSNPCSKNTKNWTKPIINGPKWKYLICSWKEKSPIQKKNMSQWFMKWMFRTIYSC